jgi:hypothetical protein
MRHPSLSFLTLALFVLSACAQPLAAQEPEPTEAASVLGQVPNSFATIVTPAKLVPMPMGSGCPGHSAGLPLSRRAA